MPETKAQRPRVVIIGGGFGGLAVARGLERAPAEVTLLDRTNHHLFQPLLYQVATAGLGDSEIASPIRGLLSPEKNVRVLMQEVHGIDRAQRRVVTAEETHEYDYLVLATGAGHSYFGHPEWEPHAPGLKSLSQALEIRRRVLSAFERAEAETDEAQRRALMTFVVVGAGPTGVELAGAIGEMSRYTLARDFRTLEPTHARILLAEAGPRILSTFDPALAAKAARALERLGVEIRTGLAVTRIDGESVTIAGEVVPCRTAIWAAGVAASALGRQLTGDCDRAGRVRVEPRLRLAGDPRVFVIGDAAATPAPGGGILPGVAPVALQQGRYVARAIAAELRGSPPPPPFRYRNHGQMATVGRRYAIAQMGRLKLSGFLAWWAWLLVHLMSLVGFRNRLLVLFEWAYGYTRFSRGARLIVPPEWRQPSELVASGHAPPAPAVNGARIAPARAIGRPAATT